MLVLVGLLAIEAIVKSQLVPNILQAEILWVAAASLVLKTIEPAIQGAELGTEHAAAITDKYWRWRPCPWF